jgi:hypothetical protein
MRNLRYLGDSLYCIAEISYVFFNLPVTCEKLVFLAWAFIKTNCRPILQVLVYCGSLINVYYRGQKQRRVLKLQECVTLHMFSVI